MISEGNNMFLPNSSIKHYQHLMMRIKEHCKGHNKALEFVDIADETFRRMMKDKLVTKRTAQKILNAYARIAPYNQQSCSLAAGGEAKAKRHQIMKLRDFASGATTILITVKT